MSLNTRVFGPAAVSIAALLHSTDISHAQDKQPVLNSTKTTTTFVSNNGKDTYTGASKRENVSAISKAKPETIDTTKNLRPADYDSIDKYYEAVIQRETAKGTLKKESDFKIKDDSGNYINDEVAYKAYTDGIKERARQFEDPNDLESFLNGIDALRGNNSKKLVVLSAQQAHDLISSNDYKHSYDIVCKLFTKAKRGGTQDELSNYLSTLIASNNQN
jgi:hypothetical protein